MLTEWLFILPASLFAGFVDAIVGGGGLVLVPALFGVFPSTQPAMLLGTNKSASMCGTAFAAWRFQRTVSITWRTMLPAALCGLLGALLGAWVVTIISATYLRVALPFLLLAVLLYTLNKKDLGRVHAPRWNTSTERNIACAVALVVGFYDGFFGPGTGSFLVFLFVRVLGYDFLHASAAAKLINVFTNISAFVLFASKGYVWWQLGLGMAVANIIGSMLGTKMALHHGAGFVRKAFIVVALLLIVKTSHDAWALLYG